MSLYEKEMETHMDIEPKYLYEASTNRIYAEVTRGVWVSHVLMVSEELALLKL